ncbi:hypothetical protein FACS1894184_08680 [Clostridia bacterium]|nr:hypothetical protein FACS1894184_08680 [Clostridia bacterium]
MRCARSHDRAPKPSPNERSHGIASQRHKSGSSGTLVRGSKGLKAPRRAAGQSPALIRRASLRSFGKDIGKNPCGILRIRTRFALSAAIDIPLPTSPGAKNGEPRARVSGRLRL